MSKDLQLTSEDARTMRWIDGEMDAAERQAFEAEMARHEEGGDVIGHMAPGELALDPERVRREKESTDRLRAALQSGIAAEREIGNADAFNKGILDRIRSKE